MREQGTYKYSHPALGEIIACKLSESLVQFRSLPYATISRRFARSSLLKALPIGADDDGQPYDSSGYGPSCIQPLDSVATDVQWNQLPEHPQRQQSQAENCLRVTLTVPLAVLRDRPATKIPVVAFIHGGALVVGSGERQYYDPATFCQQASDDAKPLLFVSINYRLGALGFLHTPNAPDLLPPNNGLYDQLVALDWIHTFISGFGGDSDNITVMGQSAGAASVSLHNTRLQPQALYRRALVLSGSSTVLVTMTPEEHHGEFLKLAERLGIATEGRSAEDVAAAFVDVPVNSIRDLNTHGAPCSGSELIPDRDWATMRHAQYAKPNDWLESEVIVSSTYDGSISYMVGQEQERKGLATYFTKICRSRLQNPQSLLDLYQITIDDPDNVALEKICQVVTDIGFFGATVSSLEGAVKSDTASYQAIFDIGNPFTRSLPSGKFATHTWDIVTLLGAYDDLLNEDYTKGISAFRRSIIDFCHSGASPSEPWQEDRQSATVYGKTGLRTLGHEELASLQSSRLLRLAEAEDAYRGYDHLWEDVVRFFLKTGNPRHAHELHDLELE